jgi:hypothetical protein
MPRYFFNYRNEYRLVEDLEGKDYPDLATAQAAAITALREANYDVLQTDQSVGYGQFELTDAVGQRLATITMRDVLGD